MLKMWETPLCFPFLVDSCDSSYSSDSSDCSYSSDTSDRSDISDGSDFIVNIETVLKKWQYA